MKSRLWVDRSHGMVMLKTMEFHPKTLRTPRQTIVALDSRQELVKICSREGSSLLIVTDDQLVSLPLIQEIIESVTAAMDSVSIFSRAKADVPILDIDEAVELCQSRNIDVILAIGGGTVIDLAKMVGLLLIHGGRPEDYYGEAKVPGPTIPLIAVPTTAGTGSEVTPVAVITDPNRALKVGISSVYLIPTFAVIDPTLTLSCPPSVTAHSGTDALCHAIESFLARSKDLHASDLVDTIFIGQNSTTDEYALKAISALAQNLEKSWRNGADLDARSEVAQAAMWAGLAFAHGGTGCPHAMQYPIGALTHTPHGLGVGLLLPYVLTQLKIVCAERMSQLARAVGLVQGNKSLLEFSEEFILWCENLLETIGIPQSLTEIGINETDLPVIAERTLLVTRLLQNHPGRSDYDTILMLLTAAWNGDRSLVIPD